MGTRVISAILTLKDKNFSTNMKKAASEMSDFERGLKFVGNRLTSFSQTASQTFSNVAKKTSLISTGISGLSAATAPAIAGVGALGASFAAAGIGAAAFGAVAVGALSGVFEASEEVAKLEEKIANADSAKERAAAQKELAAVYADMSTAQQGALKDLQNFKSFWGGFVKQFEKPVFAAFSQGLQFTQKLLTGLGPTISNVSGVVVEIMQNMNKSIDSGGMKDFFSWLETNAAESLYNFATITGNVFVGIFNMFQAFAPLGASVEEGLVSMTEKFQQWSAGLSESKGFQNFIEYATTNGPKLMNVFGNVFSVIGDLIPVLAPAGAILLDVVSKVTDVIAYLTSLLPSFSQVKEGITTTFSGIQESVSPVKDLFVNIGSAIMGFVNEVVIPLIPVAQQFITNAFQAIQPAISTVKGLFSTVSNVITTLINGVIVPLFPVAKSVISTAFNFINPIIRIASSLFQIVGSTVMFLVNNIVVPLIPKIASTVKGMWSVAKPILDAMTTVFDGIASAIEWTIGKFNSFASAIKSFKMPDWVSSVGDKISGAASKVSNFVSGSFAVGTNRVPNDMIAQIHKDEMIIPARQSERLRQQGVNIDNIDTIAQSNGSNPQPVTNNVVTNTDKSSKSNGAVINIYPKGLTASEVINELVPELKLQLANM